MSIKEKSRLFESERKTSSETIHQKNNIAKKLRVIVFHSPRCSSCKDEIKFIEKKLKPKYPDVKFEYHAIDTPEKKRLMLDYYVKYNISLDEFATPTTFVEEDYFIGYNSRIAKELDLTIKKNFPALN